MPRIFYYSNFQINCLLQIIPLRSRSLALAADFDNASLMDVIRELSQQVKGLDANMKGLSQQVKGLDTNMKGLDSKLDVLTKDLSDLTLEFQKYDPIWVKAGDVYEIVVRQSLAKLKGESYARSFEVVNLNGLARLALPKENSEFTVQSQIDRSMVLGEIAKQNIHDFRKLVQSPSKSLHISDIGKYKMALTSLN